MPFFIIFFLWNSLVRNLLLINLTHLQWNQIFIGIFIYTIFLCFFFKLKTYYLFIYLIIFFKKKLIFNVPLSNQLFIFHPVGIIYIFSTFFTHFFLLKVINYIYLITINIFTLILGGFWALQEISWGGWWNWDVVELYILVLCLYNMVYVHIFKKNFFYSYFLKKYLFIYLLFFSSYFIFNRLGLVKSIHQFVKNNFVKWNYYIIYYLIGIIILYAKLNNFFVPLYWFILQIYVFLYVINNLSLKYIMLYWILCLFFIKIFFKQKLLNIIHRLISYFTIIFFFINFFNGVFSLLKYYQTLKLCNFLLNHKYFLWLNFYQNYYHLMGFKKFFFFKTINLKTFFYWIFFLKKSFLNFYFYTNFSKI